jgi:putative transposase
MNTREIASEYRLSHWAGVLQERNASGLSIREFCKTSGVRESVYYYWQRKLREAACEELSVRAQREMAKPEEALVPSGWAVCESAEPEVQGKSMVVEINGCRVHVEADAAPDQMVKIFRALKSL